MSAFCKNSFFSFISQFFLLLFLLLDLFRLCHQLSGCILFAPPDTLAICLHDDLQCNGTCSVTGGNVLGGEGTNVLGRGPPSPRPQPTYRPLLSPNHTYDHSQTYPLPAFHYQDNQKPAVVRATPIYQNTYSKIRGWILLNFLFNSFLWQLFLCSSVFLSWSIDQQIMLIAYSLFALLLFSRNFLAKFLSFSIFCSF